MLGVHRGFPSPQKTEEYFFPLNFGNEKDGTLQHEWIWWPASTIPAMADEDLISESLDLLRLENEGWTKDQEKRLDEIWKPEGSPLTSKTHIFPEIHVEGMNEEVWFGEWVDDRLKHWIWPLVDQTIRHNHERKNGDISER